MRRKKAILMAGLLFSTYVAASDEDFLLKVRISPIENIESSEITDSAGIVKCYFTYHSLYLKEDKTLWGVGRNDSGQLGLGHNTDQETWIQIAENVDKAGCSYSVTHILKGGALWSTGYNQYGQLGIGNTTHQNTFQNTGITDVSSIEGGFNGNHLIKNDGSIWAVGQNTYGQLGLGNTINQSTYQLVSMSNVKKVSAGSANTNYLKNDGTLWSVGYNQEGQLGLGNENNTTFITQVPTSGVKDVVSGAEHTIILKNDGSVLTFGENYFGQLGIGHRDERSTLQLVALNATAIDSNGHSSFFIKDGELWGAGRDATGDIGLNGDPLQLTFKNTGVALNKVIGGFYNSFIEKSDGSIWATGQNTFYQLGLSNTAYRPTFTELTTLP